MGRRKKGIFGRSSTREVQRTNSELRETQNKESKLYEQEVSCDASHQPQEISTSITPHLYGSASKLPSTTRDSGEAPLLIRADLTPTPGITSTTTVESKINHSPEECLYPPRNHSKEEINSQRSSEPKTRQDMHDNSSQQCSNSSSSSQFQLPQYLPPMDSMANIPFNHQQNVNSQYQYQQPHKIQPIPTIATSQTHISPPHPSPLDALSFTVVNVTEELWSIPTGDYENCTRALRMLHHAIVSSSERGLEEHYQRTFQQQQIKSQFHQTRGYNVENSRGRENKKYKFDPSETFLCIQSVAVRFHSLWEQKQIERENCMKKRRDKSLKHCIRELSNIDVCNNENDLGLNKTIQFSEGIESSFLPEDKVKRETNYDANHQKIYTSYKQDLKIGGENDKSDKETELHLIEKKRNN